VRDCTRWARLALLLCAAALVLVAPCAAYAVEPTALYGTVTEAVSHAPVAGAWVCATFDDGETIIREFATTDSEGDYELVVPAGAYDTWASAGGYEDSVQSVVEFDGVNAVRQDFSLQPYPKAFEGIVTDALSGNPIANATVDAAYSDMEVGFYYDWDSTDENGSYELFVPAATYEIAAYVEDGPYWESTASGVVFDGENVVGQNFVLKRPVDDVAPVTGSDLRPVYYSHPVTIKLAATDAGTGVAATYYSLDGAAPVVGTTVVTSAYGVHTLEFWSVDNAGNTEAKQSATFFVLDGSAPVTTSDAKLIYYSMATIRFTATDPDTGVAATYYSLDGAELVAGTTVTTSVLGNHTLSFYSVNNMRVGGNTKTVNFSVLKPRANATAPKAPKTMKRNKTYTVTGTLKSGRSRSTKPVWIYKYQKVAGDWEPRGYVKTTWKGSKGFSAKIKLSKKGEWKLETYVHPDAMHSATWGKALKVKVK